MGPTGILAAATVIAFCGGVYPLVGTVEGRALGALLVTVAAESDRCLSIPLRRPIAAEGIVSAVDIGKREVRVEGLEEGEGDRFIRSGRPHYLLVKDGPGEGLALSILSGSSRSLVLEAGEEELKTGIYRGLPVEIVPHWTVETAFPDVPEGTALMVFNDVRTGINLAADQVLIRLSGRWHDAVTLDPADDTILFPGESFVLRNVSTNSLELAFEGMVPMEGHHARLRTHADGVAHDNRLGLPFPVEVKVGGLKLPAREGDALLVFDMQDSGYNPSASSVLIHSGDRWYDAVSFSDVSDSFMIQPCQGLIFRKAASEPAESIVWKPVPPYLNP
jgi:uncharacterized protein (TIGR02597 family)